MTIGARVERTRERQRTAAVVVANKVFAAYFAAVFGLYRVFRALASIQPRD